MSADGFTPPPYLMEAEVDELRAIFAGRSTMPDGLLELVEKIARGRREIDDNVRDSRLLGVWSEGFAAGAAAIASRMGGPGFASVGYAEALHFLGHLAEDPIARTQLLDRLVHHFTTGEQRPAEVVDIHARPRHEGQG